MLGQVQSLRHENKENLEAIFIFLKIEYDFNLNYITTDYHKGQIIAVNSSFNDSKIIL